MKSKITIKNRLRPKAVNGHTAEEVMRVYFSLGILAAQVVPPGNKVAMMPAGDNA